MNSSKNQYTITKNLLHDPKALLTGTTFSERHKALNHGIEIDDIDFVRSILPYVQCGNYHIDPLRLSVVNKNIEMVRLIIQYYDPKKDDSNALVLAVQIKAYDIFNILYPVSEPRKALMHLLYYGMEENDDRAVMLKQRIKTDEERHVIEKSLKGTSKSSIKRKM